MSGLTLIEKKSGQEWDRPFPAGHDVPKRCEYKKAQKFATGQKLPNWQLPCQMRAKDRGQSFPCGIFPQHGVRPKREGLPRRTDPLGKICPFSSACCWPQDTLLPCPGNRVGGGDFSPQPPTPPDVRVTYHGGSTKQGFPGSEALRYFEKRQEPVLLLPSLEAKKP